MLVGRGAHPTADRCESLTGRRSRAPFKSAPAPTPLWHVMLQDDCLAWAQAISRIRLNWPMRSNSYCTGFFVVREVPSLGWNGYTFAVMRTFFTSTPAGYRLGHEDERIIGSCSTRFESGRI